MILFRCDANKIIGAGHIMRCLSIALAAREYGEESYFVLAEDSFTSIIQKHGFKYEILGTNCFELESETEKFCTVLDRCLPQCIIVDSYYVSYDYFECLKGYGKLVYIDDRAEFAYPADILINYNIFASEIDYLSMYGQAEIVLPALLLGPEYIPLRKEFQNLRVKSQNKLAGKVLVSTGGADSEHVMLDLLKFLLKNPAIRDRFELHFVIGAMNGDINEIYQIGKDMSGVILYQKIESMQTLMSECDMAISAAGSTLYELCACGIPTITYVLADNQIPAEKAFVEKQIMISAGDCRNSDRFSERIFFLLERLSENYHLRKKMAANAYELVNADGADKLAGEILKISGIRSRL